MKTTCTGEAREGVAARGPRVSHERHVPLKHAGERTVTSVVDDSLAARVQAGDKRALARAISLVENDDPAGWELMSVLYPHTGRAAVVGFTGSPGGGKSTLISALVTRLRARHRKVGVLSIDPSSPFRGGALLGDRIRLSEHFLDPGVFIRSMATRGALGGLAEAALQTAQLMDAAGFDDVLLETVGVGRAEVDIVAHADTVVLVLIPGSGDSVQAMKAGVMEIPDVIVVNKSDHPLADTMVRQIRSALSLSPREGRRVPIVKTEAIRGEGIDELLDALRRHRSRIAAEGTLAEHRRRNLMNEVLALAGARMRTALAAAAADDPRVQGLLDAVVARRIDPANAARQMLAGDAGRQAAPLLERTLTADLED
jgi:LAO/AO transport system kinase